MRVSRRAFLKLLPLGVGVSVASWWLLNGKAPTSSLNTEEVVSSESASSGGTYDFPQAWAEHADHPIVDPSDYLFRVDGEVSNPLQLTVEDLHALPSITQTSTIRCVEGWSAVVTWEGVPLSRLLTLAGAPNGFGHVTVESITGYSVKIGQDDIADSRTMIALKAGSAPLNEKHGYPARLVLPTRPGWEWVKQVSRITFTKS